jgi:hypothetical protein
MKPMDRYLERLFHAAAAAPAPPTEEFSFAVEARVLQAFRAARAGVGAEAAGLITLFRRGLAVAGACAAIAVLVSIEIQPAEPDVLADPETALTFEIAAVR